MRHVKTRGANVSQKLELIAQFQAELAEAEADERDFQRDVLLVDRGSVTEMKPAVSQIVHDMLDAKISEEGWNVSTFFAEMRRRGKDMSQVVTDLLNTQLEGGWLLGDAVANMASIECGLEVEEALRIIQAGLLEDSNASST